MISKILFVSLVFIPALALAATGAAGDHHGVPWKTIGVQAFNFFLLAGLLIYLLKATVIAHFRARKSSYMDLVNKAEAAKKEAEANHREVASRLAALQASAQANASKAQQEADLLKAKLLKEADEISQKLTADVQRTAAIEIQKAKAEIQSFALLQAIEAAEAKLSKDASKDDQSRLQSEFIRKIQMVNQ